jgi:tetratricopeptide (TPR) repeat protein
MEIPRRAAMRISKRCTICGLAAGMLWLGTVGMAQKVPRAIPFDESQVVKAVPVDPVPPKAQAVTDPNRPAGPDEDLFDYATLCYTQKDYKIAITPYGDYTRNYPKGRHAAEAWFRLGECYSKTGQQKEAVLAYRETINRHPRSESAASAAYRLGSAAYADKDFTNGITWFQIAESQSTVPDVRVAATFNKALCLKYDGQKEKAMAAFKAVIASKNPSMFREVDIALQETATLALELGQKEDALAAFKQIMEMSKDPKAVGNAMLRSGLLLNEMGKPDEAMQSFTKSLATPELPADQRGMAVFGIIQGNFKKEDYDAVIKAYTTHASVVAPPDVQAKQLLLVGMAYKNKQQYRQAIEVFLLVEKECPDAPEAIDAGYQKLLCFYQLNDKDIPLFTERFEERYRPKFPNHEYLQMARLIRADWWFGKAEYAKAEEAFVGVDMSKVPDKVRASVIYRKGFAESEAGKHGDAIPTLTLFLNDYPKDANVPVALAQRGVSYKATRDFDKALADFATIIKDHATHPAVELALYQSGLIKSELRDFPGMIASLEELMKKFPTTAAGAEACYLIGRGYFELRQKESYAKAIDPLHKAIALNPKVYLDKASQLLISCQYLREDVDGLAKEVDDYLNVRKNAVISPKALLFLGVKFFERGNFGASARYLSLASTPDEPKNTETIVWNYLGQAQLKNKNYDSAVAALDNYLAQTPGGAGRAGALIFKGKALLGLAKFDEASQCASEGLEMVKEGRLHAQLQMLQGDIAMAAGDAYEAGGDHAKALEEWKKAAGNFVVVSQIFVDPKITPEAAYNAVRALEKIGETGKADALRKQLKAKYPKYEPAE